MSYNLEELANKKKEEHQVSESPSILDNEIPFQEETQNENDELESPDINSSRENTTINDFTEISDDDDESVIIGDKEDEETFLTEEDLIGTNPNVTETFEISDDDVRKTIPDIPDDLAVDIIAKLKNDAIKHRKNLLYQKGLPEEDANAAAMAKLNRDGETENIKYLKANPNALTIVVDKQNAEKLEFTDEERAKMIKSKVIKLEVVENKEVKRKKVKKIDKKRKLSAIQSVDVSLSTYGVPLPALNDFARFKGAQIIQLVGAVNYDDQTLVETIEQQARLLYEHYMTGSNIVKYDPDGVRTLSYNDFINKYLYHDVSMGMYGILVASSMEELETEIRCLKCRHEDTYKYNIKTLLTMTGLNDTFKQRFEDILSNKSNPVVLQNMYEKNNITHEVESPLTKCIYELNYPSLARMIGLYRNIDEDSQRDMYLSSIISYVDKILVYDHKDDYYIEIDESEYQELLTFFRELPQEELDILAKYLSDFGYTPKFFIETICTKCGEVMRNEVSIQDMVFLKVRDSSTEIQ